VLGYEV
jgi:hypothetical protein